MLPLSRGDALTRTLALLCCVCVRTPPVNTIWSLASLGWLAFRCARGHAGVWAVFRWAAAAAAPVVPEIHRCARHQGERTDQRTHMTCHHDCDRITGTTLRPAAIPSPDGSASEAEHSGKRNGRLQSPAGWTADVAASLYDNAPAGMQNQCTAPTLRPMQCDDSERLGGWLTTVNSSRCWVRCVSPVALFVTHHSHLQLSLTHIHHPHIHSCDTRTRAHTQTAA